MVTALSKLLSDQKLRDDFCQSPQNACAQLGLTGSAFDLIAQLNKEDLIGQAETLLKKRWHEVQKILPTTVAGLGHDAWEIFRYYAMHEWPNGYQRHAVDATTFIRFLEQNKLVDVEASEKKRARQLAHAP